ncbi:hypothetical protein Agub_g8702 [Astrephomene gubernaculifera]|uniref:Origin recognition complex subunit 6 n=1 Tax=Astrephomene gubernaculifera TaxID=47775 RepID=A0AAD3DUS5_9CHLO|nr:hypothetical protein Agub_g8702 [Astrephomene gubernaculifera]
MDVKHLARSLGIMQQPAINRASELLRLLKLKIPGGLGQAKICRPAVCLELACQTTPGSKLPTREEFVRYSCSTAKIYNETFTRIQRLLDVRPALDLRELVTLFGCSQLHDKVQQLMRTYKTRFLESLPQADRGRADLSRPVFLAAAFLLVARKHKATVDRAALIAKMGLTRAELTGAIEDVVARCEDLLVPAGTKGRKREREDGADAEREGADGESAAAHAGEGAGGSPGEAARQAKPRAKRGKRAASQREDEEEEAGSALHPADVAVEDLKLVLIGMGGPPGQAGYADDDAADGAGMTTGGGRKARLKTSRKKAVKARVEGDEEEQVQEGQAAEEGEAGAGTTKVCRRRVVRARHAGCDVDEDDE